MGAGWAVDSIVYSLEEEEEEKEDGEEAGFDINSNNPNLKGGEQGSSYWDNSGIAGTTSM